MNRRDARINRPVRAYFLGSGDIAVPVLNELAASPQIHLVGTGTQPDREAGRRRVLQATPVGIRAEELGCKADKPPTVNAREFLDRLSALALDVVVVAAFGQILRESLLLIPAFGCVNVHASLLPRHRGASPVNAAILAGDDETGISFMCMDKGLDTGPVYRQRVLPLNGSERAGELELALGRLAGADIARCLVDVCQNGLAAMPQNDNRATIAPKLKKKDGAIDWRLPAVIIERMTRAFDPWPKAYFFVEQGGKPRRIQLTGATIDGGERPQEQPGKVVQADKHGWAVACGIGVLQLEAVIPEGKREMTGPDFLRGAKLSTRDTLVSARENYYLTNVIGT